MNKTTLMAVALATCLGYVPAGAAEVVSSNVVGYQKLSIPAGGYALLANPFTVVGSDGETFPINDMFADDVGQSTEGRTAGLGDRIQVWNSATQGYTTYFMSSFVHAWAGSNPRQAATEAFDAGDGYWYQNRGQSAFELTVSGEVATNDVEVTLVPGYTLVCNPFPADIPLNSESIDWVSAGATEGRTAGLGDRIQVWDAATQGYTTYFMSSFVHAWAGSNPRQATAESIPAGKAFWYQNRGNSNITITLRSPLAATQN